MEFTRPFEQLHESDRQIAGGKAASLGQMMQDGFPVPAGFTVLSVAFRNLVDSTGINEVIQSRLRSIKRQDATAIEETSKRIRELILNSQLPDNLERQILKAFNNLKAKSVAIRSSATVEDGSSASWAGQFQSYLNVDRKGLIPHIKQCWASLFSRRAFAYSLERKLTPQEVRMAVVVQRMIPSSVSGVAFSVEPTNHDNGQLLIEAAFGLGEGVVSGALIPDSYLVEKGTWRISDRNISRQETFVTASKRGGTASRRVAGGIVCQQKLRDKEIVELAKLIVKIENRYGPSDVEWAYSRGNFFVLQTRPITTLNRRLRASKAGGPNFGTESDYEVQFRVQGLHLLFSDILMGCYKSLNCVFTSRNNLFTQYTPKSIVAGTLNEGVALYKSGRRFSNYQTSFGAYFNLTDNFLKKLESKPSLGRLDTVKFMKMGSRLICYYSKMDYTYTDKAARYSSTNRLLEQNLQALMEMKDPIRERINGIFLGDNSHLSNILKRLAIQFDVSIDQLPHYNVQELLDLFHGSRVDAREIRRRKMAFLLIGGGKKVTYFYGSQARRLIMSFLIDDVATGLQTLRGVVANAGTKRIIGRVKVVHVDYGDFSQMHTLIEQMNKGDVLVAETTAPELMLACRKASAIITDLGE